MEANTESELDLHFVRKDGSVVKVFYYSYDANFYLAVNGKKNVLVNKMDVKDIKDSVVQLAEG